MGGRGKNWRDKIMTGKRAKERAEEKRAEEKRAEEKRAEEKRAAQRARVACYPACKTQTVLAVVLPPVPSAASGVHGSGGGCPALSCQWRCRAVCCQWRCRALCCGNALR